MWIIFLIFVPFLTALVYVIARGRGMAERSMKDAAESQKETDSYIRSVAASGSSPTDEIAKAKKLLDDGTITAEEYAAIKAKAARLAPTNERPHRPPAVRPFSFLRSLRALSACVLDPLGQVGPDDGARDTDDGEAAHHEQHRVDTRPGIVTGKVSP